MTFDGGTIDISKSIPEIDLKYLASGETAFIARKGKQEILSFERVKLEPHSREGEYMYSESLLNESLRYTPSDIKCAVGSEGHDSKLFDLFEIKKISIAGLEKNTDYYLLPKYYDGRFEIREKENAVVLYIEFIDKGYRTSITYKNTGNADSEMLKLLKVQFLH